MLTIDIVNTLLEYVENISIAKPYLGQQKFFYELYKGEQSCDVAFSINPQFKFRIEEFITEGSFDSPAQYNLIESTAVDMIFLKSSNPQVLMRSLWEHPLFGRHIQQMYMVDFRSKHRGGLLKFIEDAISQNPSMIIRIQSSAKVRNSIIDEFPDSLFHPTKFTHVLFLYRLNQKYHFGLFVRNQCEFGAMHVSRERPAANETSRAYWKLEESFIRLPKFTLPPKGAVCLDIGGSPGGWTQCLCEHGAAEVIAVDPGDMRYKSTKVRHMKNKIEELSFEKEYFDCIVSDMNNKLAELHKNAKSLRRIISWLKPGGLFLYTIKASKKMRISKDGAIMESIQKSFPDLKTVRLIWLISNTSYERTLFSIKP